MKKERRTNNEGDYRREQDSRKHVLGPTSSANRTNRDGFLPPSSSPLEFVRYLRSAQIILVEVKHVQAQAVLYLTLTQIMQVRLPVALLGQVVGHMPGQKNVPRIAAIHYPLRDLDS